MTSTTTEIVETVVEERTKRAAWKPLAAAGIGGAVLVATGFGVFAQLSATAFNTTALPVTSGDLTLNLADRANTGGFTTSISNLAPGDVVNRFVTLTNTGTLAGKDLKLNVSDLSAPATVLTTDRARGLAVTLSYCAQEWTLPANGVGEATCGAGQSTVVSTTPVADFAAAATSQVTVSVPATALNAVSGISYLRAAITLPEPTNVENTINGQRTLLVGGVASPIPTANSIQGKAASLRFTFTEVQRDGVVTSS